MLKRLTSRLGFAALVAGALALAGNTAEARPGHGGGHGGGGHGGGGHGGGFHAGGFSRGGFAGGVRPGGAAFVRPGGAAVVRPGGAAFVRPGGVVAARPFYGAYRPYYGYGRYGYARNFYRPYYGYGLGAFALGYGLGLGSGLGGYGGYYAPYYGGYGGYYGDGLGYASGYYGPDGSAPAAGVVPDVGTPDLGGPDLGPAPQERPPQDNAAHLQLVVPDGAEVYFDGAKTSKTGRMREFVSPTLAPGQSYTYTIEVRYTNTDGKPVADKREIHVGANDWFTVDFTRPEPGNPPKTRPGAGPVMPPAADR
jgi:uncharacterized protein (TIGR03000 family)